MPGNINAEFIHCGDSFGSNDTRFCTGALYVEQVSGVAAQQTLSHLATSGIASAENQNPFFRVHTLTSIYEEWGTTTEGASIGSDGISQRNKSVAAAAPVSCARMNPGASMSLIPAKVSLADRASVTAGFANEVDAVNQYAPVM